MKNVVGILSVLCFFLAISFLAIPLYNAASNGFHHLGFDSLEHFIMILCNSIFISMSVCYCIMGFVFRDIGKKS